MVHSQWSRVTETYKEIRKKKSNNEEKGKDEEKYMVHP